MKPARARRWPARINAMRRLLRPLLILLALIFDITRPKLLQMAWFHRFYDWVMRGIAWAHALTDPIKVRIKLMTRRIRRWFRMFAPKRAGRTLKLLLRIRRRMQAARAGT